MGNWDKQLDSQGRVVFRVAIADADKFAATPAMYEACKVALEFMVTLDAQRSVVSGLSLQLHDALQNAEGKG